MSHAASGVMSLPPDHPVLPGDSSSLETEETSALSYADHAYRRHLLSTLDPQEVQATEQAYEHLLYDRPQILSRFQNCRTHAAFVQSVETGEIRVRSSHCNLRWCPLCSRSRAFSIAEKTAAWLDDAKHPSFLTLTLAHTSAPLRAQVKTLVKSFKKLRSDKSLRRHVRGGVWFLQITYNATTDQWHPHLHVLVDMDYIPQAHLSHLWLAITHTSMIVDIRKVKDTVKAAQYVARYSARPTNLRNLPNLARVELIEELHGQRIVNAFGSAHAAKVLEKTKYAPQTWTYLGDFFAVMCDQKTGHNNDEIWDAWRTRTPLALIGPAPPDKQIIDVQAILWPNVDNPNPRSF